MWNPYNKRQVSSWSRTASAHGFWPALTPIDHPSMKIVSVLQLVSVTRKSTNVPTVIAPKLRVCGVMTSAEGLALAEAGSRGGPQVFLSGSRPVGRLQPVSHVDAKGQEGPEGS